MAAADLVVAAILGLAALRGLFLGLVRESLSLAALAAACLAVRFGSGPAGAWLETWSDGALAALPAQAVAAIGLALAVLVAGALIGRTLRSGIRLVGLGAFDRMGGAVLGAAEGAVVAALALALAAAIAGRSHPLLTESRAFAALNELEAATRGGPEPAERDVAAPPRRL